MNWLVSSLYILLTYYSWFAFHYLLLVQIPQLIGHSLSAAQLAPLSQYMPACCSEVEYITHLLTAPTVLNSSQQCSYWKCNNILSYVLFPQRLRWTPIRARLRRNWACMLQRKKGVFFSALVYVHSTFTIHAQSFFNYWWTTNCF